MTIEPKRIYGWIDSNLSLARHYGGCVIDGVRYAIRYDVEGQPLEEVRPKARKNKAKPVERDIVADLLDGIEP